MQLESDNLKKNDKIRKSKYDKIDKEKKKKLINDIITQKISL